MCIKRHKQLTIVDNNPNVKLNRNVCSVTGFDNSNRLKADTDMLLVWWDCIRTINRYSFTAWRLLLFMTALCIFQQTSLVQVPSSVNSCSTSDNQMSSLTNMTIDMNTVSRGEHICRCHRRHIGVLLLVLSWYSVFRCVRTAFCCHLKAISSASFLERWTVTTNSKKKKCVWQRYCCCP